MAAFVWVEVEIRMQLDGSNYSLVSTHLHFEVIPGLALQGLVDTPLTILSCIVLQTNAFVVCVH